MKILSFLVNKYNSFYSLFPPHLPQHIPLFILLQHVFHITGVKIFFTAQPGKAEQAAAAPVVNGATGNFKKLLQVVLVQQALLQLFLNGYGAVAGQGFCLLWVRFNVPVHGAGFTLSCTAGDRAYKFKYIFLIIKCFYPHSFGSSSGFLLVCCYCLRTKHGEAP